MAGHSQFKNIMHRKGAQDSKRAKLFTKIIRELTVAARNGEDLEGNPRLKAAIINARSANMPKDTMERAIKRGAKKSDDTDYKEIRYEGYGPEGIAVIIETLTDNKNRTSSNIRSILSKHDGKLGEPHSVSFLFQHVGIIKYPTNKINTEELLEKAINLGAEDIESNGNDSCIICKPEIFAKIRDSLIAIFGDPQVARLEWKPINTIQISKDSTTKLLKLIEALQENDDVQLVSINYNLHDDILE